MNEKQMILTMLNEGKITAEEAQGLLQALHETPSKEEKTEKKTKDSCFQEDFKDGIQGLSRSARDFFQAVFSDIGDVFKDLPTTIVNTFRDFDSSRSFSLEQEIGDITKLEVTGRADSFRFFSTEEKTITVKGKIHFSARDFDVDGKVPLLEFQQKEDTFLLQHSDELGDNCRIEAEIYLPVAMEVSCVTSSGSVEGKKLENPLQISTRLGKILLQDVTGDCVLNAGGGAIRVKRHVGDMRAKTNNGSVSINGIKGNCQLRCNNGLIDVKSAEGIVEALAKTGSVKVAFSRGLKEGEHDIRSKTGMVQVALPDDSKVKILASSKLGNIIVDPRLKAQRENKQFILNGGGNSILTLETTIGMININALVNEADFEESTDDTCNTSENNRGNSN